MLVGLRLYQMRISPYQLNLEERYLSIVDILPSLLSCPTGIYGLSRKLSCDLSMMSYMDLMGIKTLPFPRWLYDLCMPTLAK